MLRGSRCLLGLLLLGAAGACATQSTGSSSRDAGRATAPAATRGARPGAAGPQDVMMRAEQGSIDGDDAEAAIMNHWPKLKACYREAGDAMTFAGGAVMLRFDVALSGQPRAVDVIESRLGNFAVESCLITAARAVRFPRPHGGGTAKVEYSLTFRSTQERPVVDLPAESHDDLRVSLLAHVFAACGPLGSDQLEATVYVDQRGRVASAGLASRAPLVPHRAACAAAALATATVAAATAPRGDALARLTVSMSDTALGHAAEAAAAATKAKARPSKDRFASKTRRRRR